MRRPGLILLGGLVALALTACSGGASPSPASGPGGGASPASASSPASPGGSSPASAASGAAVACAKPASGTAATVNVTIKDFTFTPDPVQAKVGDVIAWTNNDSAASHTATLEDDSCSTDSIAVGAAGSLVFGVAGTYTYKCRIHPSQMKGFTIVVQ